MEDKMEGTDCFSKKWTVYGNNECMGIVKLSYGSLALLILTVKKLCHIKAGNNI